MDVIIFLYDVAFVHALLLEFKLAAIDCTREIKLV